MTAFQTFITVNGLLKKDVADFLDVSGAFITQVCAGDRKLPKEKLTLILESDKGWDVSMLEPGNRQSVGDNNSGVVINQGGNHGTIDNRHYYSDSPDVLRAQIDLLDERLREKEERLKEKDAQIKEKDAQIKEKDAQIKEKDAQIKQLLDILQGKNKV